MNRFFLTFFFTASVLIFLSSVAIYLNYQAANKKSFQANGQPERKIYKNSEGLPKYAVGACNNDIDCSAVGCSSEICSSKPDIITTCEIREDFPDKNIYQCGCVSQKCAWFKK